MNGYRVFVVVAVAVLLVLLFPMTAVGAEATNVTIRVNEYIVLENDIYIELIEVGTNMGWYAEVHFYSYRDSVGKIETLYQGDTWPSSYTSGTGRTIDVVLGSAFSNGASFVIESSKELMITERRAGEEEEPEPVPAPKLKITRTIDPNAAEVGQTVKVTLTIKNTGNGTATDIMLDEGMIANTYKDGCPSTIDDIVAGETKRLSYDLKIGADAQIGTREIPPSVLNYKGESGDSDSTESRSGVLTIIPEEVLLPELIISVDPIDYVVTCGDDVPMAVTITNVGNATAEDVYVKCDLSYGVRVVAGELEPLYDSIKQGRSEEYEVTLITSEEGKHTVDLQVRGSDRNTRFEFRAEKSGLEKYYVYIIVAIPILLILLWVIKRRREYSY